jgi:hypothetical protein
MKELEREIDLIVTKNVYCTLEGNWQVNRIKCREDILSLISERERGLLKNIVNLKKELALARNYSNKLSERLNCSGGMDGE